MTDQSLPYLPVEAKGGRLAMGMRPLDLAHWLEVDERADEDLALKAELLEHAREQVVALEPDGDEPSAELLEEVRANLALYHPERPLGVARGEHPLVEASRLVQEDLCVLVKSDQWRLRAACVCFPSRWDLLSKIGTTLDQIHGPIPGYAESLSKPTNSFFDRLAPEKSYWRVNWTMLDSPVLYQPARPQSPEANPSADLAEWFVRVERQTLRQLPRSRAIVFTIRTYVAAASVLCEQDEAFRERLVDAIESATPAMQAYKGWTGLAARLRGAIA